MELHVAIGPGTQRAAAIAHRIRLVIRRGGLAPGDRLPASRELARDLGVARSTVVAAYDALAGDGLLESRVGSGTFVADHATLLAGDADPPRRSVLRPLPRWADVPVPPIEQPARLDLRAGVPDQRRFPYQTWRRLLAHQLRAGTGRLALYGDVAGHAGLRAAVARHIGVARGVHTTGDDVTIVSGTQQGVDLIARVLVEPGERVAVEDPGYRPIARALTAMGVQVQRVPVDDDGLVVEALHPRCRLVQVSPSHQYPLGVTMSEARRRDLVRWAHEHDAVIVEDDYDSEFRLAGPPVDPLWTLDPGGRVVYVGTFSKSLLPAFRLGFVVAPAPLLHALRAAKYVADWHTAEPLQAALAQFIDDGDLSRHVRRMRRLYAERHDAVVTHVPRVLGEHATLIPASTGLHLTATSPLPRDVIDRATATARDRGVAVYPLSPSAAGTAGLVLGYGNVETDRIPDALRVVRTALDEVVAGG